LNFFALALVIGPTRTTNRSFDVGWITSITINITITIITIYHHWKSKNYKPDLKDKIENHKNFNKKTKEKN
jgi:hypothetical protein